MMLNNSSLIIKLIARGDRISIEHGELVILPVSNQPVLPAWMMENKDRIVKELAALLGIELLKYSGYSTGGYSNKHFPGVNLQFQWASSLEDAYVIFNAELKRNRTTKSGQKGTPLPKNHFRVGEKSKFLKFWARTGLKFPRRKSSFHDYMGNLKKLVFIGVIEEGEKLDKDSIRPFNISAEEVLSRFQIITDTIQTTAIQATDNIRTNIPDKQSRECPNESGLEGISTTGYFNYGIRSTGNAGIRDNTILDKKTKKTPEEQTVDEWLADYDNA